MRERTGREWVGQALCRVSPEVSPEMFHGVGISVALAKRVCQGCPVRNDCLQYALDTQDQWGIWGGLDPRQRNLLLARQGIRVAQ